MRRMKSQTLIGIYKVNGFKFKNGELEKDNFAITFTDGMYVAGWFDYNPEFSKRFDEIKVSLKIKNETNGTLLVFENLDLEIVNFSNENYLEINYKSGSNEYFQINDVLNIEVKIVGENL